MPQKAAELVIAPHGLDEVLGCGGAIQRIRAAGRPVDLLVLFGDGTGRDQARRAATEKVVELLDIRSVRFGGFPENRSDTMPLAELIGTVEAAVRELQPEAVYVSHGGSLNIDHQNCFKAAVTALRPVPGSSVRAVYTYEIQSSTDWAPHSMGPFLPTRYVDISDGLDTKLAALRLYGEEMRPPPHARSLASAEQLARRHGAVIGVAAAEAFCVIREIV